MLTATSNRLTLTAQQLADYDKDGYLIVPRLFNEQQVERTRRFFDDLAERNEPVPGHWTPDPSSATIGKDDPLARYPRVLHPHRFDDWSRRMMLDPRVGHVLEQLFAEEAVACQSMYYFKAPGSRGQALHQDNFYLEVTPGNCIAAWTAIDRVDTENGGLMVVPGTHKIDLICPDQADLTRSFTTHLVNPPKGMKAVPADMQPGDVLFFNGSLIHGSGPNRSKDRWRRSFICHYMPRSSHTVARFYLPILAFDGSEISYQASTGGGPCGYEGDFVKPLTYH
ncbi:MAG: phytanoyl-CoA dioxygenase family protein [Phycisphaeraceae bacterium]|nr:phytanoyl-CoA dioxygenase family protein [Phycisphaeraceae bacterium]